MTQAVLSTAPPAVSDPESVPGPTCSGSIVQLLHGAEVGGISTAITQWAPVLIKAGWVFRFVLLSEGRLAEILRAAGLFPDIVPLRGVRRFTRLARTLRPLAPALIHCHSPVAHMAALVASRRLRVPVVRTVHADMMLEMSSILPRWKVECWKVLMGLALRRADGLGVTSPHLIERFPRLTGPRPDVRWTPNGYNPATIQTDLSPLPSNMADWLGGSPLVISMGRLVAVKNFSMLLRAWSRVADRFTSAKLVIVGSGPMEAELTRLRDDLGLQGSTRLVAWVDRIAPWLRRADVVALSSFSETGPMLAFEAMSLSKPVIATNVGSVPYVLQDGLTGLVVPSDDDRAMAEAIGRALENPAWAAAIGRRGHEALLERFTDVMAAKAVASLYAHALRRRQG